MNKFVRWLGRTIIITPILGGVMLGFAYTAALFINWASENRFVASTIMLTALFLIAGGVVAWLSMEEKDER